MVGTAMKSLKLTGCESASLLHGLASLTRSTQGIRQHELQKQLATIVYEFAFDIESCHVPPH